MSKTCQKLDIKKKMPKTFIKKKEKKIVGNFFEKCQVFGNFMTFKWQFSGGSDSTNHSILINLITVLFFKSVYFGQ